MRIAAISSLPLLQAPGAAQASSRIHPAVVRVIVQDRSGRSHGSGALVAVTDTFGMVLTNWHVVRDAAAPPTVVFPDGFQSAATIARVDRDWDLAALVIWRPRAHPIPLAAAPPRPGELLAIAGYGKGQYRVDTGRCTQYLSPGRQHPYELVELTASARQGDSGGPIFNERGELAGVLFGSAFGRTTGSHSGRVRQFLAPLWNDFYRVPDTETMIAGGPQTNSPVATIQGVRSVGGAMATGTVHGAPTAVPHRAAPSAPAIAAVRRPDTPAIPAVRRPDTPSGPPVRMAQAPVVPPARAPGTYVASVPGAGATGVPPPPRHPIGQHFYAGPPPASGSPAGSVTASVPHAPPAGAPIEPWAAPQPAPQGGHHPAELPSRSEQVKTILAALGVLALVFHGVRLLGRAVEV